MHCVEQNTKETLHVFQHNVFYIQSPVSELPKYLYLVVEFIVGPVISGAKWNRVTGGDCNKTSVHKICKKLEFLNLIVRSDNLAIDENKVTEKEERNPGVNTSKCSTFTVIMSRHLNLLYPNLLNYFLLHNCSQSCLISIHCISRTSMKRLV